MYLCKICYNFDRVFVGIFGIIYHGDKHEESVTSDLSKETVSPDSQWDTVFKKLTCHF